MAVNTELLRLGPLAYSVKRKASPKQWKKIVTDAHTKGYTVDSYLNQSIPNEFKARTKESLKKQATTTLNEAYKPAEKMLDERESRISALASKRKQDNEFYMDWLTRARGQMQTSANAADQALRESAQATYDDALAAHQANIAQAADRLTQQPGNVSSRDELLKQVADQPEFKRHLDLINSQRNQIDSDAGNNARHRAAADANVIAQQAAIQAAQASETWKSLTEVADDKLKVQMEKGAAIADQINRLLGQEIEKAGANRDFAAVLEKLDIQGQTLDLKTLQEQFDQKDALADNDLNAQKLAETKRRNKVLEDIANAQLDLSAENVRLGWYKARKQAYDRKNKGKSGATKYEDTAQGRFDTAYGSLSETLHAEGKSATHVARNPISYENLLVKSGLSRELARRVVRAYVATGAKGGRKGKSPGDYRTYGMNPYDPKPRG